MREIKFRAWEKGKGMSPVAIDLMGIVVQGQLSEKEKLDVKELLREVFWMQYTGLKDKNGKEIYEGDIVKLKGWQPTNYEVVFNRGGFCLKWGDDSNFYNDIKYAEDERGEVIGNIYQNKDLIKNNV